MLQSPLHSGLLWIALAACCGCAGYQVGVSSLYRPDIRTVHVPVFQSDSFRPHLGERLTEAVIKQIQLRSPYRVAPAAEADSVLSGRIISERKRLVAESAEDDARDLEVSMVVQISWIDHRGDRLMQPAAIPLPPLILNIAHGAHFVPEGGQSSATAQQEAIEQLAREIVGQMEAPW